MNRAVEFYLETRHCTIKSLHLKNDTPCASGDGIDCRYQYKHSAHPSLVHLVLGFVNSEENLLLLSGAQSGPGVTPSTPQNSPVK